MDAPLSPDDPADLGDAAPEAVTLAVGTLPPGPVADRLAEAATHVPDRPQRVLDLAEEALALADGDPLADTFARIYRGFGLYLLARHDEAADVLTRALADVEPLGDLAGRSLALGALASVRVSQGHYDVALDLAEENLAVAAALGDRQREAWVRAMLGNTYLELERPEGAIRHGEAALTLFADLGEAGGQARAHTVLGGALMELGRYEEAKAHHESALRLAREGGNATTEARALHDLGRLALARDDAEAALGFHRRALRLRAEIGARQAQASSLIAIGRAMLLLGRPADARVSLAEALAIAREVGAEPREADALAALADAAEAEGEHRESLGHLRAAVALRERVLSAQARSRIHAAEARADAERARQEAETARVRTDELGALNDELQSALDDLRAAQRRLVQTEKLASIGRLSAGLAHEIRNPLNFVAGFADLNAELATDLLHTLNAEVGGEPPDPEAIRDDLESIVENARRVRDHARRAEAIVTSLMGHVRTVGGERQPVDLHGLIDQALDVTLGTSPVTVERDYADLGPVAVEPGSIRRVFTNLLDNARWATEAEAAPAVWVSTAAFPGGVEVRVRDNGRGIPVADCERVFEPFFTTRPTGSGTGLGLSMAYDIVTEGHGGTLAAHSREGEGATFVVTLPVEVKGEGA